MTFLKTLSFILIYGIAASAAAVDSELLLQAQKRQIKHIRVVSDTQLGLTNADGSGLLWETVKAVYEPLNIAVDIDLARVSKAQKMLAFYGSKDLLLSDYRSDAVDLLYPTRPIKTAYFEVAHSSHNKPLKHLRQLKNKRVGWPQDLDAVDRKGLKFQLKQFKDPQQGMFALLMGEIDYYFDESASMQKLLAELGRQEQIRAHPLLPRAEFYPTFAAGRRSALLVEIWNQRIEEMLDSQELQALYAKWNVALPETLATRTP